MHLAAAASRASCSRASSAHCRLARLARGSMKMLSQLSTHSARAALTAHLPMQQAMLRSIHHGAAPQLPICGISHCRAAGGSLHAARHGAIVVTASAISPGAVRAATVAAGRGAAKAAQTAAGAAADAAAATAAAAAAAAQASRPALRYAAAAAQAAAVAAAQHVPSAWAAIFAPLTAVSAWTALRPSLTSAAFAIACTGVALAAMKALWMWQMSCWLSKCLLPAASITPNQRIFCAAAIATMCGPALLTATLQLTKLVRSQQWWRGISAMLAAAAAAKPAGTAELPNKTRPAGSSRHSGSVAASTAVKSSTSAAAAPPAQPRQAGSHGSRAPAGITPPQQLPDTVVAGDALLTAGNDGGATWQGPASPMLHHTPNGGIDSSLHLAAARHTSRRGGSGAAPQVTGRRGHGIAATNPSESPAAAAAGAVMVLPLADEPRPVAIAGSVAPRIIGASELQVMWHLRQLHAMDVRMTAAITQLQAEVSALREKYVAAGVLA